MFQFKYISGKIKKIYIYNQINLLKYIICFIFYILFNSVNAQKPVLKNNGIPNTENYDIVDHFEIETNYVIANVEMITKERNGSKYYHIIVKEGNIFLNEVDINYEDLTTISEKRTDLRINSIVESYNYLGDNKVYFYNKEKKINKIFKVDDANIYSRHGIFFSFRGFPFSVGKCVYFKTFISEYGDALPMKLTCVGTQHVKVKAGDFECYKLELSVAGILSIFVHDKYYLYFAKDPPHLFVKYEEHNSKGTYADELININNQK